MFQLTAARRRLAQAGEVLLWLYGFNSQPPEGGWNIPRLIKAGLKMFQLTAARRRLVYSSAEKPLISLFQLTAARRRLERLTVINGVVYGVCFNSQPPEGGWRTIRIQSGVNACFNSQPPEGGWLNRQVGGHHFHRFQLTAARRRLGRLRMYTTAKAWFQLTAARRRLDGQEMLEECSFDVSTHSRPKAAGGLAW